MDKVGRSRFPRSALPDGIGEALLTRRVSAGLSPADMASAIGSRRETVYRIEKGHERPSSRVVFAIAKVLEVEVKDLVPGWDEPADPELPCYGPRVRHRRRQLGLTLADVAAAVALTPSMLSRFECEQSLPRRLVKVTRASNGQIECKLVSRKLAKILGFKDVVALDDYCNAHTLSAP